MSQRSFSWELFKKVPIIGIIRNFSAEDVQKILPVYQASGLTTIEITMNTAGAKAMLKQALEQYPDTLNIGAGTVCTEKDLEKALEIGAQFIVTPIINKKVIRTCAKKGIPVFPGAFTPSEIYKAWTLGASMVKVFPSTTLGPAYIKDLKGPLSQIELMPTGGVSLANMSDFFAAGADGLGIGSQLFDKTLISKKNWTGLKEHFQKFVKNLPLKSEQPV